MDSKREKGQFFTKKNLFKIDSFKDWFLGIDKKGFSFVEPFAGDLDLPKFIEEILEDKINWNFYDIDPQQKTIIKNDSIKNFPKGYDFCITNPPYLAKNSAKRRGLSFPNTVYDDLYKLCLEKCLENCNYVVAIIPESFITAGIFHERLDRVISLTFNPFDDTEHPVCIALFSPEKNEDFKIFRGEDEIGYYSKLKKYLPKNSHKKIIKFNSKEGQLGLIALDNTKEESINFCQKENIKKEEIKVSSRARTRIFLGEKEVLKINKKYGSMNGFIEKLNARLKQFRNETQDVFMTSFKGLREDGKYRRRLDYKMAKKIIAECLEI